jgi:uncharacterized protein YeaO (DUF488 family)
MEHPIALKRAYEAPSPGDDQRVLVDRLWPRGVSKEKLNIAEWYRTVAPSSALRIWFGHDPARWTEFKKRYFAELESHTENWRPIAGWAIKGKVTLVYGARDTEHNDAVALKEFLEIKLARKPAAAR